MVKQTKIAFWSGVIITVFVCMMFNILGDYWSDPEFENCTLEVITFGGDTLRFDSTYIEIESGRDVVEDKKDNFLIPCKYGDVNIYEADIKSFTLTYHGAIPCGCKE